MALIKKSDVTSVSLPQESIEVPELGGSVIVRGMLLRDRLELSMPRADRVFTRMSALLASCVLDADSQPVYTADEWEIFGAQHYESTITLLDTIHRLSDLKNEEAEKKELTAS